MAERRFGAFEYNAIEKRDTFEHRPGEINTAMIAVQADECPAQVRVPERRTLARQIGEKQNRLRIAPSAQQCVDRCADRRVLRLAAQQREQPRDGIGAILSRSAKLMHALPVDRQQSLGRQWLFADDAEYLGGPGDVVGTSGPQRAETEHRRPGIVRATEHRLAGETIKRLWELRENAADQAGRRDQRRHD